MQEVVDVFFDRVKNLFEMDLLKQLIWPTGYGTVTKPDFVQLFLQKLSSKDVGRKVHETAGGPGRDHCVRYVK